MKKSKPLDTVINFLNFQSYANTNKTVAKEEKFGATVKKLQKIVFRRPLGIPNFYSGQKDVVNYITSRNMRKTLMPSNFKNVFTESETNTLVNIKYILDVILNSLKKSNQLMYFPSTLNIFAFHAKKYLLRNLISNESKGDIANSNEEDDSNNWGGQESYKLIKFLKDDFNEVIQNTPAVIVLFYAYWCNHCLKLKAPYGKAALMAKEAGIDILFAAFDVTVNPDIADEKGVVGIPILKYYKDGKFVATYKGKRTSEDLLAFLKNPPDPQNELKPPNI